MEETLKLVSAGDCIQIWNLLLFSPETYFNPHESEYEVSSVCWSSNNILQLKYQHVYANKIQFFVSATSEGDKICVSTCKTKPVQLCSLAEQSGQTCVSLNSTSNLILSGGTDCAVNMWDLKTSKLQKSYEGHKDIVTCLTNDCDDQWILSGSRSGEIVLHSMHTDEAAMKLCCQSQQPLQDLQVSSLQKSLLGSVGNDGTVVLWDLNSLQLQHSFKSVHKAPATALCFSPVIESLIVTVGLDKRISAIDTRCKLILHSIRAESPLTAVELLPDGTTLMIGSSQGKVSLYDFRNMEFPVKSSKAHRSAVRCIKLQTMKGKLQKQAAWPTAWSNMKEEAYSVSVATDVSSKSVTSDPRDSYSLQVSSFTASKPSQYRKVMFLATNSFGEIFSPIRSDVSYTNISTIDEFSWTSACHALSCSPLPESESNIMTLGDHSTLAVRPATETLELFLEATCLTAKKFGQAQNLHYCTSAQELIEQETNSRTVAKPLSHPSTSPVEERKEEHTTPLVIVRLLENILKDALEEFSEMQHREVVGLQLTMIQEFQNQQVAIGEVILKHLVVREELIKEFVTLKEENQKLNILH